MIFIHIALLLLSFYLLAVICEDYFIPSLDTIAAKLKLPSDVAGATLMAMGSSAPEFFTALFAVFRAGQENVGSGTIVGSAIFNILVITGASASFRQAKLTWQPVLRDLLFYVISIILLLLFFWDGKIVLYEAIIFVTVYALYIIAVVYWKKILPYSDVSPLELNVESHKKPVTGVQRVVSLCIPHPQLNPEKYLSIFTISIILLAGLSYVLVESAVSLGNLLHINPTIIALTVLAAGTSIPDLMSSIIVAKQGRGDMAVSNAVGSNIFDILFSLGFAWTFAIILQGKPITVQIENLLGSVFLLFATVLAILILLVVRKWTIGRRAGLLLIGLYGAYLVYTIQIALN